MTLAVMLIVMTVALGATLVVIGKLVRPDPAGGWLRRTSGRRDDAEPDPFISLHIQERLGSLAGELQELQEPSYQAASAHRLAAARLAYDDLLHQACTLAGVPPAAVGTTGEDLRRYEEQQLAERGWSW